MSRRLTVNVANMRYEKRWASEMLDEKDLDIISRIYQESTRIISEIFIIDLYRLSGMPEAEIGWVPVLEKP